ncbi:MAG: hypothetical protein IT271_13985 [Chitinophagales bacterium]|nr:hypothetical protein [Chitinophagales bacterium]
MSKNCGYQPYSIRMMFDVFLYYAGKPYPVIDAYLKSWVYNTVCWYASN